MTEGNQGWLTRLKAGLSKTSSKLSDGITGVFVNRKIDAHTLEALEELLIQADVGAIAAAKITRGFGEKRLDKNISPDEVKGALAVEIAHILSPVSQALVIDKSLKPHVILMVGVNGNGKTTTIGKLAHQLKQQNYKVMLAAVDTFRAAAVEQLKVWGTRTGCEVVAGAAEADPGSVAYQAFEQARAKGMDVLLIDSAGRLQNKANLMAELQKIIKVLQKLNPGVPHSVIQVLDATTGQNALSQVEIFKEMVHVTGLIVTKLDGTAKGGIAVAIADKFGLPMHALGVGEAIEDLRSFDAFDFAQNLMGLTVMKTS